EAAALYRDKLHDPLTAARCLEAGGLLGEAADAYLELKLYENAGDVFRRLQRDEQANAAYRAAVEELRARRDIVEAARVLDAKLDARPAALGLLWSEWPDGPQAVNALREYFALLARA